VQGGSFGGLPVFLAAGFFGDFAGGAAFSCAAVGYTDLYAGVEGVGLLEAPPAEGFPPLVP